MAITWKKKRNLKPAVILNRIETVRSVSAEGMVSFLGYDVDDALPALQSMLNFPAAANEVERSRLVWKALCSPTTKLTPDTFTAAINSEFAAQNAARETRYNILTSLSLKADGLPRRTRIDGSTLQFLKAHYPRKFTARTEIVARHRLSVEATPDGYCRVIVNVKAKSPFGAATKALRALDIQRAVWCLIGNAAMEHRGNEWLPINRIRLGGVHTVHHSDGKPATDQVWFEPNYTVAQVYYPSAVDSFRKAASNVLRALNRSSYRGVLTEALLRYVRALDERDQNNAFIKLWGAIESLASSGSANYEPVTRRCSFLFRDTEYHGQILEHLREYRNQSVHAGDQSSLAKAHCYQLQRYFFALLRFHLANAHFFTTLEEANSVLDLPPNKATLLKRRQMIQKAIRIVS